MSRLPDPDEPALWLDAAYRLLHSADCDGCSECSSKCAGAIQVWREEYILLRLAARAGGLPWPPDAPQGEWDPCPFLDASGRCAVYLSRPFICRAFGLVPWLPCSLGKIQPLAVDAALRVFGDYASRPRKTLAEWTAEDPSQP
jgi:hypothetical protein